MVQQRLVAVVVTHDRRDLLTRCLDALQRQTLAPEVVVVVDNGSTDGTSQLVAERWPTVDLVSVPDNLGGAGGFALGIQRALEAHHAEAVWAMDDDTVPDRQALAELVDGWKRYAGDVRPALVASRVLWTDGTPHPMNTPRPRPFVTAARQALAQEAGGFEIRSASFVSVLIDGAAARAAGLPIADYFLWNDDFEYTARLLRDGVGLLRSSSTVRHLTSGAARADASPGNRFWLEVRNKVWLVRSSAALTPPEKLVFAGLTLVRWVRVLSRAPEPGDLSRQWLRGIRLATTALPRPNDAVLPSVVMAGARP